MYKPLTKWLKETLKGQIDKVSISTKLVQDPLIITTGEHGWTANMERIQRAQTLGTANSNSGAMFAKKTLEINPGHPIIKNMLNRINEEPDDQ